MLYPETDMIYEKKKAEINDITQKAILKDFWRSKQVIFRLPSSQTTISTLQMRRLHVQKIFFNPKQVLLFFFFRRESYRPCVLGLRDAEKSRKIKGLLEREETKKRGIALFIYIICG